MPDIASLELGVNPSRTPSHYPGRLVEEDCLLVGSWIYPLITDGKVYIGDWSTIIDGGPLSHDNQGKMRVDSALSLSLEVKPMAQRFPLIAVGSNASPGQIIHKFSDVLGNATIPLTRAAVVDIEVAHSAHVSRAGYIPYAPMLAKRSSRRFFILWLDSDQLRQMDATEPNYQRFNLSQLDRPAVIQKPPQSHCFHIPSIEVVGDY